MGGALGNDDARHADKFTRYAQAWLLWPGITLQTTRGYFFAFGWNAPSTMSRSRNAGTWPVVA
jgi:hypothetical protein